jgi:hypothetical protein
MRTISVVFYSLCASEMSAGLGRANDSSSVSGRVAGYWLLKREAAVVRREAGRAGADQRGATELERTGASWGLKCTYKSRRSKLDWYQM